MIDRMEINMQAYSDLGSSDLDILTFDPAADNTTATISSPTMGDIISNFGIEQLALTLTLSLLIILTIVGNIMILVAIATHRALHSPQKYLIASLAVSDLMVGVVVMPISLTYEVIGTWILSNGVCNFWLSMDILYCTASILNLCVISLDRYWAITSSVKYRNQRTTRRILIYIVAVWLLSLAISFAPVIGWISNSALSHEICYISQNMYYTVFSTFGAFFIPATIILVVYYKIYAEAKKSIRKNLPRKDSPSHITVCTQEASSQKTNFCSLPATPIPITRCVHDLASMQNELPGSTPNLNSSNQTHPDTDHHETTRKLSVETTRKLSAETTKKLSAQEAEPATNPNGPKTLVVVYDTKRKCHTFTEASRTYSFSSQLIEERLREKHALALSRERQATRSVSIVTGCFLICWLPFFLVALIMPLCGDNCHLSNVWKSIFLWLGYTNSMLDPIIYTVFNKDFKEAFKKMLCSKLRRRHSRIIQTKLGPKKIIKKTLNRPVTNGSSTN